MKMILKITKEYEKIDIIRQLLYKLDDIGLDVTFNNTIPNKYALNLNNETLNFTTYTDVINCLKLLLASIEKYNKLNS